MAEWEPRFKQMMLEAGVFSKEMVQKEPISAALNRTEVVDTPEEVNLRGHMFKSLINWPAMITFVTIGAVLGATFGSIAIPAGLLAAIEPAATAATTALLGALVGGGLASVFGVNSPIISNHFNNFFDKIFSGEMFGKPKQPVIQVPAPVLDESTTAVPPTVREKIIVEHAAILGKHQPHASFQDRLALEKVSPVISQQIH